MPDTRKHRGQHPEDARLFHPSVHERLRTAAAEYSWLLTRSYAVDSALTLVGDHHSLTARQRLAIRRSACSDQALGERMARQIALHDARGGPIAIDGYNLLITVESALSGGIIFIGRDGCCRDLASVHGTYRKVEETVPAVMLIADYLGSQAVPHVDWYLDRPVSNSGRLKVLMAETLGRHPSPGKTIWNIELVASPDTVLSDHHGTVATADSAILDRCGPWVNLAKAILEARAPGALKVDLRV